MKHTPIDPVGFSVRYCAKLTQLKQRIILKNWNTVNTVNPSGNCVVIRVVISHARCAATLVLLVTRCDRSAASPGSIGDRARSIVVVYS